MPDAFDRYVSKYGPRTRPDTIPRDPYAALRKTDPYALEFERLRSSILTARDLTSDDPGFPVAALSPEFEAKTDSMLARGGRAVDERLKRLTIENAPIPEWQGPIQVAEPVSVEAPVQEEAPIPEWQGPIQAEPAPTQKPDAFDQYVAKYGEQIEPDAFDQYVAKYGQQERRAGLLMPIPPPSFDIYSKVAGARAAGWRPGEFGKGLRTGLESARVGVGETLENVGARGIGQAISEAGRASQAESAGKIQRLEDIKSPRDLVDWTAFAMGQGLGSMAAPVMGGLAGAAVAGPPGAIVGALGASYVMLLGEIRGSLEEAGVDEATINKVAPLAAIPAAAMDAILPGQVGKRAVSGVAASFGRELAKRVVKRSISGAITEGVTEAGQEAIIKGTTAALSENVEFLTMETLSEMTNAMAAGALPGAGFGSVSAVSEGRFAPPTVPEPGPLRVQPEPKAQPPSLAKAIQEEAESLGTEVVPSRRMAQDEIVGEIGAVQPELEAEPVPLWEPPTVPEPVTIAREEGDLSARLMLPEPPSRPINAGKVYEQAREGARKLSGDDLLGRYNRAVRQSFEAGAAVEAKGGMGAGIRTFQNYGVGGVAGTGRGAFERGRLTQAEHRIAAYEAELAERGIAIPDPDDAFRNMDLDDLPTELQGEYEKMSMLSDAEITDNLARAEDAALADMASREKALRRGIYAGEARARGMAVDEALVAEVEATPPGQDPSPTIETTVPVPEGRIVSLRKEEGAEIRDRLGLDALPAPERQSFEEVWDEAISQTAARHAVSMANQAATDGRPLTPVEHAAAVQRYVELERELGSSRSLLEEAAGLDNDVVVQREEARSARLLDEIDILTTATDRTGTEAGRALSVRRLRANVDDYSLARGLQGARTNKGAALTPVEISQIETLTKEMETLQTANESLVTENASLTSKREKSLAQATVKTEVRTANRGQRTTTRLEKLTLERTSLLLQLGDLGYRLNDVTGVSVEGLGLIGKLAVNSIRVAAVERGERLSLDAVVKEVLSDLNNESITERDVHEALAGRSLKATKRAESMAQQHVRELKTQANLLAQIDDAERGVTAPTRTRAERSVEVKALQKILTELRSNVYSSVREGKRLERALRTIDELQDQLTGRFRPVRAGAQAEITPDMEALKEQIAGLRRELRTEDALSDVQEQLRTGDFKIPEKREQGYTSPALERNQIALRKARKQWRQAIADMRPMGLRRVVGETTAFLRTMKATADMSATLRQALLLSARRPVMATKAFGQSTRAFFSQHTSEQIDNAIREHPNQLLRDKAGLELTDYGGSIGQREEEFASSLAERIPVFGHVVRASNRSMTTTLNLVRTAAFDGFLDKNPNATSDELKAWANWVNVASGRGDLGRAGAIATELSTVFFAPRFAMSRIQTPYAVFKHWQQPRVRKEIAKDYAAVLSVGMMTLALASLAGLEVGLDPREPDFGRIRFGDNRVDIWAGVQQPMRLLARVALAATDRAGLTGRYLSESQKDVDPLELLGRFAAFKAGPLITIPREILRGKTAVSEPTTLTQTAARSVTPIILEGVYEAYRQGGAGSAAVVGAGEFLGLGMQTYGDSESRVRRDVQKLLAKGDHEGASALVREWNEDNPERRIVSVRVGETGSAQQLVPPRRRLRAGPAAPLRQRRPRP